MERKKENIFPEAIISTIINCYIYIYCSLFTFFFINIVDTISYRPLYFSIMMMIFIYEIVCPPLN